MSTNTFGGITANIRIILSSHNLECVTDKESAINGKGNLLLIRISTV